LDAPYPLHDAVAQDEHALAPVNAVPLLAVRLEHQELGAHLGLARTRKGKRVARRVLLLTIELSLYSPSPPLPLFLSMLGLCSAVTKVSHRSKKYM